MCQWRLPVQQCPFLRSHVHLPGPVKDEIEAIVVKLGLQYNYVQSVVDIGINQVCTPGGESVQRSGREGDPSSRHLCVSVHGSCAGLSLQVKLFADADIVIIMHGAAMTNIAFMRPYSCLIEVLPTVFDVSGSTYSAVGAAVFHCRCV